MSDPRYNTRRWKKLRAQVLRRDGHRCAVAGCIHQADRGVSLIVDHVIEVKDGGPFWDPANLQVLCKPHHDAKTLEVKAGRGSPRSPNA